MNVQFSKHKLRFLSLLSMFLNVVGEEEEFQYNEDNEQLNEYDGPQCPPQCHAAEPIIVQMPYIPYPLHTLIHSFRSCSGSHCSLFIRLKKYSSRLQNYNFYLNHQENSISFLLLHAYCIINHLFCFNHHQLKMTVLFL